jgi:hypothetical protein
MNWTCFFSSSWYCHAMRSLTLVAMAIAALALNGCGTVANFASMEPKAFGGLERDMALLAEHPIPSCDCSGLSGTGGLAIIAVVLGIVPAEFLCTAVGDILTLPITMALDKDWPPPKEEPVSVDTNVPAQLSAGAVAVPKSTGDSDS